MDEKLDETKLKPCPFCGSEDVYLYQYRWHYPGSIPEDYTVRCENAHCADTFDCWGTIEEVISVWNYRPIEDALNAEIERLRAADKPKCIWTPETVGSEWYIRGCDGGDDLPSAYLKYCHVCGGEIVGEG